MNEFLKINFQLFKAHAQSSYLVSCSSVGALMNVEEALRRSNRLEVDARNQMLLISRSLRQIVGLKLKMHDWFFFYFFDVLRTLKKLKKRRKFAKRQLIYKGKNLLAFDGARDDYAGFGRYLNRCILTKEERKKTCWFAQRTTIEGRCMASEEDEKYFRGMVFWCSKFFNEM